MIKDRFPDIKALIFDCDGTLVDSPALYAVAWVEALGASGHAVDEAWYRQRAGLSGGMLMDAFETTIGRPVDRAQIGRHMWRLYSERIDELAEIAEVADIARDYHGRLPMAVASSGPAAFVKLSLKARSLDQLFDAIVTVEDVEAAKPAPDLFLEAARRLGIAPEDCLVFEDSAEGVAAARAAGCQVIEVHELIQAA